MAIPWYAEPIVGDFGQQLAGFTYPVQGEDIEVPYHTPITAIFSGTVANAYYDQGGGQVVIQARDPSQLKGIPYYYYVHLDLIDPSIQVGSNISAGQFIGLSGGQTSGGYHPAISTESNGPHLELGESKTPTIPYQLSQITSDLNPDWMLQYAQNINLPYGGNTSIYSQVNTCPQKGQKCTCSPGYSESTNGQGNPICKNNNFPYDAQGCLECGTTSGAQATGALDQISNILNGLSTFFQWLSNPNRIIKLFAGFLLIGIALLMLIEPEKGIAKAVKGFRI